MRGRWILPLVGAAMLALASAPAPAGSVDWAKLDSALETATFVRDDSVCASCHQEYLPAYEATPHARAFAATGDGSCESCHGPRSLHVEDPEGAGGKSWSALGTVGQSAVCLQCHQGASRLHWAGTVHASAEVGCSSCHVVMEKESPRGLLARGNTSETCYTCHADVRGQMLRTSRHPVREERVTCADCHDVHGSLAPQMLRGNTVNESCYTCHTEKRGPFVWEHAPVRESCLNCHEAHGSNHRNLLVAKDPFLCLSCHSYGGHINLPRYNRVSNPYGTGCSNCHVTTHGSNHPSGAKQTR